jgi:hypothetical protein
LISVQESGEHRQEQIGAPSHLHVHGRGDGGQLLIGPSTGIGGRLRQHREEVIEMVRMRGQPLVRPLKVEEVLLVGSRVEVACLAGSATSSCSPSRRTDAEAGTSERTRY